MDTIKSDSNPGQFIHHIYMWFADGTDRDGNTIWNGPHKLRGLWVEQSELKLTDEAEVIEEQARMLLPGFYHGREYSGDEYDARIPDDLLTMAFYPHDEDADPDEDGLQPENWEFQQSVDGTAHQILIMF